MKYLMFLGVWAVAFFVTTPLFAQVATPTSVTEDEGSAVLVATVNVANLSHVQQDNLFTISFDISNRIGVQPGVKYGVLLGKTEADSFTVVDQRVYDEVLVLGEGEVLSKTITYRAPKALDGTYSLVLVIANESGLNYAFMPIAEVTLKQSADGLRIDTASCYLTVKGSDTTYSPQQRVDIVGGETLVSHCMVQNTSDKPVEVTPSFEMRKHSPFGPMVSMVGGDRTPITLAPSEGREIAIELPTVNDPQDYVVKLRLGLEEVGVTYRFQLQGASATIENVLFDKTSYSKGDMAEVTVSWSPVSMFNGVRNESTTVLTEPKITAIIVDENREVCADPVQEPLDQNGSLVDTLLIPITKDCVLSTAEITIQDTEYGALARTSYSFENVAENVATPPVAPTEETLTTSVAPQANVSLWLSILGLLLGLGLMLHMSWKRNKEGVNKAPLAVLILLLGSMVFGAEPASADTFRIQYGSGQTRKVFDITANLFNPSTPDPSIVEANGSLGITGTIRHVNGTMSTSQWIYLYSSIDAGANNLLYSYLAVSEVNYFISPWGASVTAPGTLGSHTLKIKADVDTSSITLPFTVIAPAGAPCPATTINGCLLPARASGSSAGSCATTPTVDCNTGLPDAAGECIWSGTCSYSCNDSNWNPGYNACALELAPTVEPNLVSLGVTIVEPPVYGGGGDIMFNDTRETDTFTGVWGGIKKAVHKILALDKPQQALAVYEGQTLDLSAGFENNSSTAINNQFTNRFYYQWGVTTGAWINVPGSGETVHASIGAGATRADFAVFTVPARESDTLYIRHCLDVLDQVAEYGTDGPFANCSISSVTVQAGTLVCTQPTAFEPWKGMYCTDATSCGSTPSCVVYDGETNLTTNAAGPVETFVDEPVELVAQVVNNGSENTGGSFVNLFQVADDPFGTGAVDVGTQVVDPLGGLGRAIVRFNYVFPASAAGTNKFIRVCADKSSADNSGVIVEANELLGDNCGPWNSILIKPGCLAGETKNWSENGRNCSAITPAGIKNEVSTLNDVTGPDTGSAEFLCQNNRTWAVSPQLGATCSGAITHCAPVVGKTWTVDSNTCSADAPQTAINTAQPLTDATGPETGFASFVCRSDGTWEVNPEVGAMCTTVASNNSPSVSAGSDTLTITLPTDFATPIGVEVRDDDGSIASVEWVVESSPSGSAPSISDPTIENPTLQNLDVVGEYVFKITATDNLGAQNSDTVMVVVQAAPEPRATINANPMVVSAGGMSQLTWDSDLYTACSVAGIPPSSDSWNGLDGSETTSPLTINTTYVVTCDGAPRANVTIQVSPDVIISANKYIVRPNEPIEISWDTKGNDESLCTLTQNGQVTNDFLDGDGIGSKTVTVTSRTRFVLSCGGQPSHIDIELRPTVWNS